MAPKKTTAAVVGLTVLAVADVPNFLAGFLPSLMTIGRFAAEPEDLKKLRRGEMVGSALALSVGAAASLLAGTPLPFAGTVFVLLVLLYEYERAISQAKENPNLTPMDQQ